ncbi:MAG: thioredoxin domain-containing protein [Rhizobiales bacterium]|nr:thioredoxin domain-containing protein [Hyphomicrobiales bacterium]
MSGNLLATETSPYLLQHKDNPVHWMAWSPQAFERAKAEDKPVLLSVGYAACHWCHVMAHESFEDEDIAGLMNANFINIKVDREERPDVDKVYMTALHALGEQGGWPLTMFLGADGRPFWGGTYFPPESKYGRPGFKHVLSEIARLWKLERHKIESSSTAIVAALQAEPARGQASEITGQQVVQAADIILNAVDPQLGGLRGAPKFPQAPVFDFLWATSLHPHHPGRAAAVTTTLTQISQGGIYDHLGGGIARYSVDAHWLVPHFEKMLYDNAQFVSLLTRAWLKTRDPLFQIRIEETLNFVLSEMTTPEGVFASSYDADSEGEEGKYYVWSKSEIDRLLGSGAALFCKTYGVKAEGNWEAHNILNRSLNPALQNPDTEAQLTASRKILLSVRRTRVPPGFDNKVLADWNGLMIASPAEAAFVFGRDDWAASAQHAMASLMRIHWSDNRLLHSSKDGDARHEATSDDYANLITACRALHLLTGDSTHIATAVRLATALFENHWDHDRGGYLFASRRVSELPVQTRTIHDDAAPNANGVMLANLAALHHYTGSTDYLKLAQQIGECFAGEVERNPFAAPTYLKNIRYLSDPIQIVATGDVSRELLLAAITRTGLDTVVHRIASSDDLPTEHPARLKFATDSKAAVFICRGMACAAPAHSEAELNDALAVLSLHDRP